MDAKHSTTIKIFLLAFCIALLCQCSPTEENQSTSTTVYNDYVFGVSPDKYVLTGEYYWNPRNGHIVHKTPISKTHIPLQNLEEVRKRVRYSANNSVLPILTPEFIDSMGYIYSQFKEYIAFPTPTEKETYRDLFGAINPNTNEMVMLAYYPSSGYYDFYAQPLLVSYEKELRQARTGAVYRISDASESVLGATFKKDGRIFDAPPFVASGEYAWLCTEGYFVKTIAPELPQELFEQQEHAEYIERTISPTWILYGNVLVKDAFKEYFLKYPKWYKTLKYTTSYQDQADGVWVHQFRTAIPIQQYGFVVVVDYKVSTDGTGKIERIYAGGDVSRQKARELTQANCLAKAIRTCPHPDSTSR